MTEELLLFDTLPSLFADIIKNKEQQREIDNLLVERHCFPRSLFIEMLANYEVIHSLSEEELCVLTLALYEVTGNEQAAPAHFYSKREIAKAAKYERQSKDDITLPYTMEGVIAAPSGRDFVTMLSYQEIRRLWNSKVITYNLQAQRLSKNKLLKDGTITEKPDINLKSVKNITRLMLEGKYKADTLLINILVDGHDRVAYEAGSLTVYEGTTVNLIDGMHRVQAILNVLEEEPDYEGIMNVAIKYYPLSEAQFLLGQINTVNRFDKTLVKHYMAESIGSQVAKDLMLLPELKKRISIKTSIDKKMDYLTNFAVLSESIDHIFEPQNNKDRYDITEVLKKFFGYLIPAFEAEFVTNMQETAKKSWINHHNTFVGFIVVAKKLYDTYGKDYPVDEIVRIIGSIDLSRDGSPFDELMTTQGKVNSNKVKRQIKQFFEQKVEEFM
ncbi:DNA sulfur modification protein DndB [Paenibacillus sp. OSY-SE]|uniref:DNA sulfur modification protein DndB n=1 Tax=Paenibacillus sp. OSY-SE TaxID=1196323 RepID=UPI0002FF1AED|nr:DNA sulfur modification protein DndB [Paenibacillus sp. OSY-SE]